MDSRAALMDHGDGRFASRFRPDYAIDTTPMCVGMCPDCRRDMWTNAARSPDKLVGVSGDGIHCEPCMRLVRDTGKDPRAKKGNPAERVPAEMAESDPSWRDVPWGRLCEGMDPEPFDPDPFPEDALPDTEQRRMWVERRRIAKEVCADCPVFEDCRRYAQELGMEGLHAGRFYRRNAWRDLLNLDVWGPTIHTPGRRRPEMVERLRRRGLDADGEPLELATA